MRLETYGETYEGRPLTLATITSPRLQERLGEVREANLGLADGTRAEPRPDRSGADPPVVVWLAYGVHGNESSSAEAAMLTAWALAAGSGDVARLLEHTVVLVDPLVNPDGRERYVAWYETQRGREPDPRAAAAEHDEPWPGGRQNHYLLDLNRDWAWASQRETRDRIAAYRRWEPQVYVDFHEMSPRSTYFFPPPADPVHPELDRGVIRWLDVFGEANAAAFDRQGWTYYVREVFDLFYPGYGDTYPGLRGAVGMTYEMAGGGSAGQLLELGGGRRLSLADRIARHTTTGLATVRTAAAHRGELLRSYARSRRDSGPERTYLWPADRPEARALADLLTLHGVEVGVLREPLTSGLRSLSGGIAERAVPAGTWAVSTAQPLGRLVRALMEPMTEIPAAFLDEQRRRVADRRDPEFFDVTAWSLPLAFNLNAVRLDGAAPPLAPVPPAAGGTVGEGGVGYLVPPQGLAGYGLVASLLDAATDLRVSDRPFRLAGRELPAGTVFVPRAGNDPSLAATMERLADERGIEAIRVASSLSEEGPALGSSSLVAIRPPAIGLVGGEGTLPTSFGFAWHLLDRDIGAAVTRLDTATLGGVDLGAFDVLILPDGGGYDEAIDDETVEHLRQWLRGGGVLVAIAEAGEWLHEIELSEVAAWEPPEEDADESDLASRELLTPGAIVASEVVRDDLLVAGLPGPPPVLFYGETVLRPTGRRDVDVLRVADEADPVRGGFAWPEARERLRGALLVSSEEVDEGRVVRFAQEPDFRLFWRGTAPIFLNAVLYGPSLRD